MAKKKKRRGNPKVFSTAKSKRFWWQGRLKGVATLLITLANDESCKMEEKHRLYTLSQMITKLRHDSIETGGAS